MKVYFLCLRRRKKKKNKRLTKRRNRRAASQRKRESNSINSRGAVSVELIGVALFLRSDCFFFSSCSIKFNWFIDCGPSAERPAINWIQLTFLLFLYCWLWAGRPSAQPNSISWNLFNFIPFHLLCLLLSLKRRRNEFDCLLFDEEKFIVFFNWIDLN